jgi:hypothetical protein
MSTLRHIWQIVAITWIGMFVSCYLIIPILQARMPNDRLDYPAVFAVKMLVPFTIFIALFSFVNLDRWKATDERDSGKESERQEDE